VDTNSAFPEPTVGYESKIPIIKNLFWKRVWTATSFGEFQDTSVILDLGCQKGHVLETVRKFNSQCECWGIDIDPRINTLKIPNCQFKVGDARNIPFPDSYFSIVFVLDVLEHIDDTSNLEVAIAEIRRVLMPKGCVIVSGPTESWFYRLCRFIQFGYFSLEGHYRNIYSIEEKIIDSGFTKIASKSLPGFPIPTLFRVGKFQKQI
jgi:ubiquinone/menaquinone biosynthesis C-methylase UbiE